jgi:NAD(P)-dependent dehydrogenase (short-subunit alcohol dehydrogenase family)
MGPGVSQKATDIDVDLIRKAMDVNLYGLIQTTQGFLQLLRKGKEGHRVILNVTTDMASNSFQARPDSQLHVVAYNTSKAAANSYTIALAHELKADGVKVNCFTPGFTSTKLNGFAPGGRTAEEGAALMVPWALLGPEESAKTGEY